MAWFNPFDHNPSFGGGGMPVGQYAVGVLKASVKDEQTNPNNKSLNLEVQITNGEHQGKTGVIALGLWNDNEKRKSIAAGHLAAICFVTQTWSLDSQALGSELVGKQFIVKYEPQADNATYTNLRGVWDMQGNEAAKPAGQAAAQPQQAQPNFQQPQPQQSQPNFAQPNQPQPNFAQPNSQPQPNFQQPQAQQPQPNFNQPQQAQPQPNFVQNTGGGQAQPNWAKPNG